MSKFLKPTLYTGKGLENQLRNCMYNLHDLGCGCNNPRKHLTAILNPQQCLSTKDHGCQDTTGEKDFDIDTGDLAALFDATDDATG